MGEAGNKLTLLLGQHMGDEMIDMSPAKRGAVSQEGQLRNAILSNETSTPAGNTGKEINLQERSLNNY